MFYNQAINTQDALQAKGFLLGHSRMVTEGIYLNKFAVGAVQRPKGVTHDGMVVTFNSVLKQVSDDFKEKTGGYAIQHDKGRFILAWEGEGKDPLKLFTGSQMKLNKLEEKDITTHAGIVTLFDMVCDQVVDEFTKLVEAGMAGKTVEEIAEEAEAVEETTEETVDETAEETEAVGETVDETAEETEAVGETAEETAA